jgi:hypothetical protein
MVAVLKQRRSVTGNMIALMQRMREIAHCAVRRSGSARPGTVSLRTGDAMGAGIALMEQMSWTVQHKRHLLNAPVMNLLAQEESLAAYRRDEPVTECQTAKMGLMSWVVPAAEILNFPAETDLALTLGENVMEDQTVGINLMRMFVNVGGVDLVNSAAEAVMSAYRREGDAIEGQIAEMGVTKMAVLLQRGLIYGPTQPART